MSFRYLVFIALLGLFASQISAQEARVLRFPATNGKQIVFSFAGDLYSVAIAGGVARKLTSHEGYEMFPRFSADGKTLAFTGQYDGNTEVFTIPAQGGLPQRLTWTATLGRDDVADRMGPNNIVLTWKNRSNEIVFRSRMRSFNSFIGQLYTVGMNGDVPAEVEVPRGGFCSFSPDDSKMAYNRVFREFRTWKRYRGGMADDVWIYDFASKKIENVTDNPAQDIIPMWAGDKIYFLSDREANGAKRMNLYSYDLKSKATTQHTRFSDFDIKFPSLGPDAIVFEQAGYIHRFDLASGETQKVSIQILQDFTDSRGGIREVADEVTNFEISPDGKRALFGAHGEVFTVPAENGPTRNLTRSSGAHERNSKWSPDGKWIAWISDASGENEIYVAPQDGKGAPRQLTKGADTYYYQIHWSPDSKKILWGDKMLRLRYVDVASGKISEVDKAIAWEIRQYAWSPDSRFITFARNETSGNSRIYIHSLETGKNHAVTDGWYNSNSPVFSADGSFLLFASSRDFNPIYSWTEWNHAYNDMERIYMVALSKTTDSPFKPVSDEVAIKADEPKTGAKDKKKDDKKEDKKEDTPAVKVVLDLDGLQERVIGLPIDASSYGGISMLDNRVYYNRRGSKDSKSVLLMYDLKEQKETELGNFTGYEISADGKKMLVSDGSKYAIVDLPKGPVKMDKPLKLSNMEMAVDLRAEWNQIFNEGWRQMRDFFYAPNMHGVDWEGVRKKYLPLVAHVQHRNDLTYLLGEMVGELNVGHAYVGGGQRPQPERIPMGLLGAEVTRDASGYYRITTILKGENWDKSRRSPLRELGVNVSEGDYIIAVNGHSTKEIANLYAGLVNTAGKQVVLTVNGKASPTGSREVTVEPIRDESSLYYYDWVQGNIDKVSRATNDEVGYIHIPDMGPGGLNEFVKHFYPQLRKKALIVDVRGNGGGNVSPMIIERLRREVVQITMSRNAAPDIDPGDQLWGPMVCLVNEFSASDGDLFAFRFKELKMGKLIGKRSWGGVVGIRGSLPYVDGGSMNKPEFSRYDVSGKEWVIENIGVEPDIVVDNDPATEYAGEDQQLSRAIQEILLDLKTRKKNIPAIPPYPVR